MKAAKIILAFSIVWSGFVLAEPYAEWGVLSGGMPLEELDPEMEVPDVSGVPIPPPPDAKFINVSGDKFCTMGLRTRLAVEEVCDYYEEELMRMGYSQADAPELNPDGCQIFKDGDAEAHIGVTVEKSEDPMFVDNGITLVLVHYIPKVDGACWN